MRGIQEETKGARRMDVTIPKQLQNFRFIKLKPDSKEALETGFTEKNNYSADEIKNECAHSVFSAVTLLLARLRYTQ